MDDLFTEGTNSCMNCLVFYHNACMCDTYARQNHLNKQAYD
jgi:hypothetical protein